jgi:superfamily II DNA or RNA helicase
VQLQFHIQNNFLCFTFDYDYKIIEIFKQLSSKIHLKYDNKTWKIPLSELPIFQDYFTIPLHIQKEYDQYYSKINEIDFIIEVSSSYSKLVKCYNFDFDPINIEELCSFEPNNARYTNAYKNGTWDGKYKLFNKETFSFPSGLLDSIIDDLELDGYSYQIKYMYQKPILHQYQWKIKNVVLRDYQLESITQSCIKERGILQLPTGSGKSIIAGGIIAKFGVNTLFLVHTKDLLYQTYSTFSFLFPTLKIGILGDGHCDIQSITIATIQTIAPKISFKYDQYGDYEYDIEQEYEEDDIIQIKMEKQTSVSNEVILKLLEQSKLIIFDECQHCPAISSYKILMNCSTPYKFGLNATPFRNDGFEMKIEAGIGQVIYKITASKLIQTGYLVNPHIKFIKLPSMSIAKKSNYGSVYRQYIVDNLTRNTIIKVLALKHAEENKQILILVKHIRHLNILHTLIPQSQIIEGKMKGKERTDILESFKQCQFRVLIATTLADEGLDVPNLNVLILAGGGISKTKAMQRVGRVIRLGMKCPQCQSTNVNIFNKNEKCICKECHNSYNYNGKQEAIVYDFVDMANWLYNHYLVRKTIYEQEEEFKLKFVSIQITQ